MIQNIGESLMFIGGMSTIVNILCISDNKWTKLNHSYSTFPLLLGILIVGLNHIWS